MNFKCPHCGKRLEVNGTVSGQSLRCPACDGVISFARRAEGAGAPEDRTMTDAPSARSDAEDLSAGSIGDAGAAFRGLLPRTWSVAQAGASREAPSHYEILGVLGEGGMGVVYQARQNSVNRTIALKMLKPESSREAGEREKFLAEAVVTADLDHPNIVPVHELGVNEEGTLFYAMKEVRGRPWKELLPNNSLNENLEILLRVADAVAFAHSKGVIHRDLKPENVMLGDYGEVVLMDWGLAAAVRADAKGARLSAQDDIGGTPNYMSPEQARGEVGKMGPQSDVYLLGAILYEIVAGKRPHAGKDVEECLSAAAENRIEPTEKKGELVGIALKAMAGEPEQRYATVKDFQAAVQEYRRHAESIALAALASEELEQGRKGRDYTHYNRAMAGYEQALKLWSGNKGAAEGLRRAKLEYAGCAFEKGDLDLAWTLLDLRDAAHRDLFNKVKQARQEREERQKRLKRLKTVATVSSAAAIVVLSVAVVWIGAMRRVAVKALADFQA